VADRDARRTGARPHGERAEEFLLLGQPGDEARGVAFDDAERGDVFRQLDGEHALHEPHHEARREHAMDRVFALDAHAVDDLVPFVALVEQLGELFGRVLQVAVQLDDPAARRAQDPCLDRGLLPVVAREADELDAGIARRKSAHHRRRSVAAPVVDEHDLEGLARRIEDRHEPIDELADVPFFVVNRNDDRMERRACRVHLSAASVSPSAVTTRSTSRSVSCG
jgi:hypothetical protein